MTISLDAAWQCIAKQAKCTLDTESIEVDDALGRVLAENVYSSIAVPPQDNSAMDGVAICSSDIDQLPHKLEISQRIAAGTKTKPLIAATAARIFTGGVIPHGADCVVMQENCRFIDDHSVEILSAVKAGSNIRRRGQDVDPADCVAEAGTVMTPIDIAQLSSVGTTTIKVFCRLKVGLLSLGDELVAPGEKLAMGQIYNSNRPMLKTFCQQLGCSPVDYGVVEDRLEATRAKVSEMLETVDVLVTTGGASVGEEDHLNAAVSSLGEVLFHKLEIKPGKPVMFSRMNNKLHLGLPGNPVSSYTTFALLGVPLLQRLQGAKQRSMSVVKVVSNFAQKASDREQFLRVQLKKDASGLWSVEKYVNQSSGVLSSLVWADGLVRISKDKAIMQGDYLDFLPLLDGLPIRGSWYAE